MMPISKPLTGTQPDDCVMCGEKKATKTIPNPNGDEGTWRVCDVCDDFVRRGSGLALECLMQEQMSQLKGTPRPDTRKLAKKWMEGENPEFDPVDKK